MACQARTDFRFKAQGKLEALTEEAHRSRAIHDRQMRWHKRGEIQPGDLSQAMDVYFQVFVVGCRQKMPLYIILRHAGGCLALDEHTIAAIQHADMAGRVARGKVDLEFQAIAQI